VCNLKICDWSPQTTCQQRVIFPPIGQLFHRQTVAPSGEQYLVSADQLFAIGNLERAGCGLDIILRQDGGTFTTIGLLKSMMLGVRIRSNRKEKFSYSDAPIPFDTAGIRDMVVLGGLHPHCKLAG
jgi:hypothetical protein